MIWEVTGANRETGEEQSLHIEAETEDSAIRRGNRNGLLVSTARPLDPADSQVGIAAFESVAAAPPASAGLSPADLSPAGLSPMEEIAAVAAARSRARKRKQKSSPVIPVLVSFIVIAAIVAVLFIIKANNNSSASAADANAGTAERNALAQPAKPNPPAKRHAIRGAILLANDGVTPNSATMLKGVTVYLIPTSLPPSAISPTLLQSSDEWETSAAATRTRLADTIAADERDKKLNDPTGQYADEVVKERAILAEQESSRDQAKAAAGMVLTMKPLDVYELFRKKAFGLPNFTPTAIKTAVAKTQTDADGKYEMTGIPSDDYFVYASLRTETMQIDWLVRVTLDGQSDLKVDLTSSNALLIHNINR